MKIVSVVGARPQFIKVATLSREIRKLSEEILVHTGQHYDYEMSQAFFRALEIPKPDYNLGVGSGTHCEQLASIISRMEKALREIKPDIVLTFGDTNSTLGAAIASVKSGYPTAHIEAGLRSYNREMPEEINRVVTDHISNILFCPTASSVDNLAREGIIRNVFLVGDVMVDVLLLNSKIALQRSMILQELNLSEKEYLVATIHRPSNVDKQENLGIIVNAFIASGHKIIFPLHPRTEKMLNEFNLMEKLRKAPNIVITKPLDYMDFQRLIMGAGKILTDSGGVQKEAYVLKVPCITLREETEWIETVNDGWNVLVGVDERKILEAITKFEPMGLQRARFGDGKASIKIARILHEGLQELLEKNPSGRSHLEFIQ